MSNDKKRSTRHHWNAKDRKRVLIKTAEKGKWVCQICHKPIERKYLGIQNHPKAPTLDHIIPAWAGGKTELSNLQIAHKKCNSADHKNHPEHSYPRASTASVS